MSLKSKTLGILLLVSLFTAAALYYCSSIILRREFSALEEREVSEHLKRVQLSLASYTNNLTSKLTLLAQRDETYAFMSDQDEGFIKSNVNYESLAELSISELSFISTEGSSRTFEIDAAHRTVSEVQGGGGAAAIEQYSANAPNQVRSGYADINGKLTIFAAVPVVDGRRNGEPRGLVVAAAAINDAFLKTLAEQSRLRTKILNINKWRQLSDSHGLKTPQMSELTFFRANPDLISGYASIQGADGRNVGVIEVTIERVLVQSGERAVIFIGASLLIVMAAALLASLFMLHLSVLSPLARFQRDVRKINYRRINGARVTAIGHDELSQLGTDINILLSALEQTHQDLETAKAAAERANESKSIFFSSLSHDIKNTVGAIKGWLETGLRKRSGPEFKRCMSNAYQATSGLVSNISGLLDYERVESGSLKIDRADFSLEKLLQEVRLTVSSLLKGSRVIFGIKVPPSVPDKLNGDVVRLQRILTNLLSNSATYTNHGRIFLEVSAKKGGSANGVQQIDLTFKISDTGLTIKEADIPALFEPLSAVTGATKREDRANRFGLFVCKALVEAMGGELSVTSGIGEGTTFEFLISSPLRAELTATTIVDKNIAVVSRLSQECPVYQAVKEATQRAEVFATLRELSNFDKFDFICVVTQVGEALGESELLNQIKDRVILCVDSRNDHDLQEYTGRGFHAVLTGPVLSSELLTALSRSTRQDNQQLPPVLPVAQKPYKILYVDDSEINRIAPGELLKEAGYEVSFANDGEELMALAEGHFNGSGAQFDLIITDVFMPRMDGTIAAQNIRALEKRLGKKTRLPIVAVTGYSSDQERTQIMSYGINDVIDKPVNPQELSNVLAKFLIEKPTVPATAK